MTFKYTKQSIKQVPHSGIVCLNLNGYLKLKKIVLSNIATATSYSASKDEKQRKP